MMAILPLPLAPIADSLHLTSALAAVAAAAPPPAPTQPSPDEVAIGKTCGPGRFIFSPTSCGNLYYSPDIFEAGPVSQHGL